MAFSAGTALSLHRRRHRDRNDVGGIGGIQSDGVFVGGVVGALRSGVIEMGGGDSGRCRSRERWDAQAATSTRAENRWHILIR